MDYHLKGVIPSHSMVNGYVVAGTLSGRTIHCSGRRSGPNRFVEDPSRAINFTKEGEAFQQAQQWADYLNRLPSVTKKGIHFALRVFVHAIAHYEQDNPGIQYAWELR